MRAAGVLLVAVIILGIAQSAVAALAMALLITLVWGALFRPRETFAFLAFGVIMNLLERHPWACVGAIGCLIVAAAVAHRPPPP